MAVPKEDLHARPEGVHRRGQFLTAAPGAHRGARGREEARDGLVVEVRHPVAPWANVARPGDKRADVAAVLADRVLAAAVGCELNEEALERLVDAHGASLDVGLGIEARRAGSPTVSEEALPSSRETGELRG